MQHNLLIDYCKAIEDSSARMLEAAEVHDWDEVVRCEGACAVLIDQLPSETQVEALDDATRVENSRIMLRIMDNISVFLELAQQRRSIATSERFGTACRFDH